MNRGGIPVRQRGMRQEMNHCSMKRSLLFIFGMYPMDPKKSQPTVNSWYAMAKRAHCKRILCTLIWIDLHFYGRLPLSSWGWWLRIVECNWYSRYMHRSQNIKDTVILLVLRQCGICSISSFHEAVCSSLSGRTWRVYVNFWQEHCFYPDATNLNIIKCAHGDSPWPIMRYKCKLIKI